MSIRNHLVRMLRIVCTPRMFAAIVLVLPLLAVPGRRGQTTPKIFKGEVTDTICAKTGSHDEMMAKMPSMGRDKATCTKQCAGIGAKYVLYDEANKAVYKLDDPVKLRTFAGRRVQVKGTLDGNEIKVTDVRAVG